MAGKYQIVKYESMHFRHNGALQIRLLVSVTNVTAGPCAL